MNEYAILFLNGITINVTATDWKDAIIEGKLEGQRRGFACLEMKSIYDDEGMYINNIDLNQFSHSSEQKICGIQDGKLISVG